LPAFIFLPEIHPQYGKTIAAQRKLRKSEINRWQPLLVLTAKPPMSRQKKQQLMG